MSLWAIPFDANIDLQKIHIWRRQQAPNYKFTLHSGRAVNGADKRDLQQLSADLCSVGFVVVQRTTSGYSKELKPISLLERAIASIEPTD